MAKRKRLKLDAGDIKRAFFAKLGRSVDEKPKKKKATEKKPKKP